MSECKHEFEYVETSGMEDRCIHCGESEIWAELQALREAARQHILAIEKYQYGQTPAVPLPGVAKTANELAALLESSDE